MPSTTYDFDVITGPSTPRDGGANGQTQQAQQPGPQRPDAPRRG